MGNGATSRRASSYSAAGSASGPRRSGRRALAAEPGSGDAPARRKSAPAGAADGEADRWRHSAARALKRPSQQRKLASLALLALRKDPDGASMRASPEYAAILQALVRKGANATRCAQLEAALLAWGNEEPPRVLWTDTRGVNLVLRQPRDAAHVVETVQRFVDETCLKVGSCDPFMNSRAALSFHVHHVEEVTNLRCWETYVAAREDALGRIRARASALEQLPSLQTQVAVAALEQLLARCPSLGGAPMRSGVNEALLWHGTHATSVDRIVSAHFDLERSGSNAGSAYGRGVYLAEAFNKADEYSRAREDGLFPILLCRCTVGRYHLVDSGLVDGNGGGNKWVKTKSEGGWFVCESDLNDRTSAVQTQPQEYDSLIGDRRHLRFNRFREVVILRAENIFPALIVWYSRGKHGDSLAKNSSR